MKKIKLILILATYASMLFFNGCYTDTINKFSTFALQIPLLFNSSHTERWAPDTSYDDANLNQYQEYRDNKDKIDKAEFLDFNYRIDSLVYEDFQGNVKIYDPKAANPDVIGFDTVQFFLKFPSGYTPKIGEFLNKNVAEYYRKAHNIIAVNSDSAKIISDAVKHYPDFQIVSIYSKVKINGVYQDWPNAQNKKHHFPYVLGKYDLIIRLQVKL